MGSGVEGHAWWKANPAALAHGLGAAVHSQDGYILNPWSRCRARPALHSSLNGVIAWTWRYLFSFRLCVVRSSAGRWCR